MAEHFNLKTAFFFFINKLMKWNVLIDLEEEIDAFAEHRLFGEQKKL